MNVLGCPWVNVGHFQILQFGDNTIPSDTTYTIVCDYTLYYGIIVKHKSQPSTWVGFHPSYTDIFTLRIFPHTRIRCTQEIPKNNNNKISYLVMCEISNQFYLNIGIARDTAEDLGTFKSQFWISIAMI